MTHDIEFLLGCSRSSWSAPRLVGLVVAVVVGEVRKHIDDPTLEITVTL
jgi:hypothetical protein